MFFPGRSPMITLFIIFFIVNFEKLSHKLTFFRAFRTRKLKIIKINKIFFGNIFLLSLASPLFIALHEL